MSPSTLLALKWARAAATFYTLAWGACLVFTIAVALALATFSSVLDVNQRGVAAAILGVFAVVGLLLPLLADAALAVALPVLARSTGKVGVHPVVIGLFVVFALTLPLLATAFAVAFLERAFHGVERAPPFPSTRLTLWYPIGAVGAFSMVAIAGIVVVNALPVVAGIAPVVGALLYALGILVFGGLRIWLGLTLRAAFTELLSRPAVDDMHASHLEPVAGG